MTVNQIYAVVNSTANQALGRTDIAVSDAGGLVSLGDKILSSAEDTEKFYNALTDRIGHTIIAIRYYEAKNRSVVRNAMEWGCILQKISFALPESVENPTWDKAQQSPFDVEDSVEAKQKLFSKIATWSIENLIWNRQLSTAFTNASSMGAFISGLYTAMYNAMNLELERIGNVAVNSYIAGTVMQVLYNVYAADSSAELAEYEDTSTRVRNLVTEWNSKFPNNTLTADTAITNAEFLKFASREINLATKQMQKYSVVFNGEDVERFTPADSLTVEILDQFASATASYLEADTYHKEIISLPMYEEVAFWQGSGDSFAFADCAKVAIKLPKDLSIYNKSTKKPVAMTTQILNGIGTALTDSTIYEYEADTTNKTASITIPNVIGFVHDRDAVAATMYKQRTNSIYNPRSECDVVMLKAETGYAVDLSENGIIFTLN